MIADEIREQLRILGDDRVQLAHDVTETDHALGEMLAQAQAHPEINMSEAAQIAGIGRSLAYKLMAKVGGSGA